MMSSVCLFICFSVIFLNNYLKESVGVGWFVRGFGFGFFFFICLLGWLVSFCFCLFVFIGWLGFVVVAVF